MTWTADLPVLVTLIAAVLGGGFLYRHGGGTALTELERANGILEKRIRTLERENSALHAQVSELQTKTDIAAALQPLSQVLINHDERSANSDRQMIVLLELIAQRLGPEPEETSS